MKVTVAVVLIRMVATPRVRMKVTAMMVILSTAATAAGCVRCSTPCGLRDYLHTSPGR